MSDFKLNCRRFATSSNSDSDKTNLSTPRLKPTVTQYRLELNCETLPEKLLFKNTLRWTIEIASLLEVEDQKAKVQLIKGVITGAYLHERNI